MELVVGRVAKAHGVTGEVVVDVRTDDPEIRFARGNTLRAKGFRGRPDGSYTIESARAHGGRLLVRLAGVNDRDSADALRGTLFVVDSGELPPITEPDEYYDHQLEGLQVRTTDGEAVGTVAEVMKSATLSELYQADIQVVQVGDRYVVVGEHLDHSGHASGHTHD